MIVPDTAPGEPPGRQCSAPPPAPSGQPAAAAGRPAWHNAAVMVDRSRAPGRRTRAELRRLLIQTGMLLILDEGIGTGAEHLTFKRVYDHLERTRGIRVRNSSVIGRLWANQADFQTEVLRAVARQTASSAVDQTLAAGAAVLATSDRSTLEHRRRAMVETLRQGAAAHVQAIYGSETWPPWVGVWALAMAGSEPDGQLAPLGTALVAGYEEVTARYEEQYAAMLAFCGFRIRSPFTLRQFTVAAGALAEGCALRERVDEASVRDVELPTGPEGAPQAWTLFGIAVAALLEQFVEPDPDWEAGSSVRDAPSPR